MPHLNFISSLLHGYLKRLFFVLLLTGYILSPIFAQTQRPKIGLVLSGGGARGFAHIGTLHMIDSLNIPIDYIAGTSMGGIAGALYAIGYDAIEIERIVKSVEWAEMFTDDPPRAMLPYVEKFDDGLYQMEFGVANHLPTAPSGLIRGQRISLLFSRLAFAFEHVADFDSLPIPYRCVTVDLISGQEVVLRKGSLAKAMRSTMSIPSLFFPVEYGDSLLIDGGLLNNLPTDVAKEMGSEVIIAVNVGRPKKTKEELGNLLAILEQSITIPEYLKEDENKLFADILISPELTELSPAVFTPENVSDIIEEGYRSARARLPDFLKLIEMYQLSTPRTQFEDQKDPSRLHSIRIAGNTTLPFQYIYTTLGLNPGDSLNYEELLDRVRILRASGHFKEVNFEFELDDEKDLHLEFRVKELQMPLIFGMVIMGNKSLSFWNIYNLLNIHSGDRLNIDELEQKLTELYSLGYFETVNYEIEPVNEESVRLHIQLKEKPNQRISLGFHYNNFHDLVGHLSYLNANTIITGLRLQTTLDFSGLTRFKVKALYPHGNQGVFLYPFIQAEYVKEPIPIHSLDKQIALYSDQYYKFKIGVGLWPNKSTEIEAGFERKPTHIYPEIGMIGMPEWKDDLRLFTLAVATDKRDESLMPSQGWKMKASYELSSKTFNSDLDYNRYELFFEAYIQHSKKVNLGFHAYLAEGFGVNSINYQWFYIGGPDTFIGIDYFRLGWHRMGYLRADYRYEIDRDLYLKASYCITPNIHWRNGDLFLPIDNDALQGIGIGLLYNSGLGPIELIYSRGGNELDVDRYFQNESIYFTAGMNF